MLAALGLCLPPHLDRRVSMIIYGFPCPLATEYYSFCRQIYSYRDEIIFITFLRDVKRAII